jgi:dTDP-4-amino-4,6-dideoxy-D-glucose acyltransferase
VSWYETNELHALGLHSVGENVRISTTAKFYRPECINVGSNSRIDDFVTLTAGTEGFIDIGEYVHIAAYCMVEAPKSAIFSDFSGLAARVTVYGSTDDFRGDYMTNPCVPMKYRHIRQKAIYLGKQVAVGANSVILPGAYLGEGCSVDAMSVVIGRLEAFGMYAGVPAKRVRDRSRRILELKEEFLKSTVEEFDPLEPAEAPTAGQPVPPTWSQPRTAPTRSNPIDLPLDSVS